MKFDDLVNYNKSYFINHHIMNIMTSDHDAKCLVSFKHKQLGLRS